MYAVPLRASVAPHLSQTLFSSSATCVPQPVFQGHCAPFVSFCHCRVESKRDRIRRVKRDWEIIADRLSAAGWSWGCVSTIDSNGRTIWIADAHRGDEMRCLKKRSASVFSRSRSYMLWKKATSPREAAHGPSLNRNAGEGSSMKNTERPIACGSEGVRRQN